MALPTAAMADLSPSKGNERSANTKSARLCRKMRNVAWYCTARHCKNVRLCTIDGAVQLHMAIRRKIRDGEKHLWEGWRARRLMPRASEPRMRISPGLACQELTNQTVFWLIRYLHLHCRSYLRSCLPTICVPAGIGVVSRA